jgi:RNA polymerase sigma-70 factor (ECF subfamily)
MPAEVINVVASKTDDLSPDLALAEALRNGEPDAAEEFVRRFGARLLATARRFLHRDADAEDAVQEGFLSAIKAIEGFNGYSTLGTWLHRIIVNVCLMKLRDRRRRSEISIEGLLPTFDGTGHHARAVSRWNETPLEQLARDETRMLVRRCIDSLSDDYRAVLFLRDIEQQTTQEAAEILDATPGTIKTRLHRARQALRTLLEPHFT